MSSVRRLPRRESVAPFSIVLWTADAEPVVLQSAFDADGATLAFYTEWRRLAHTHVVGELRLVRHGQEARPLLREPLQEPPETRCHRLP